MAPIDGDDLAQDLRIGRRAGSSRASSSTGASRGIGSLTSIEATDHDRAGDLVVPAPPAAGRKAATIAGACQHKGGHPTHAPHACETDPPAVGFLDLFA